MQNVLIVQKVKYLCLGFLVLAFCGTVIGNHSGHLAVKSVVSHLSLVPLEVWEEYKANVWVRIFINYPLNLCLLLQDVANPLSG